MHKLYVFNQKRKCCRADIIFFGKRQWQECHLSGWIWGAKCYHLEEAPPVISSHEIEQINAKFNVLFISFYSMFLLFLLYLCSISMWMSDSVTPLSWATMMWSRAVCTKLSAPSTLKESHQCYRFHVPRALDLTDECSSCPGSTTGCGVAPKEKRKHQGS